MKKYFAIIFLLLIGLVVVIILLLPETKIDFLQEITGGPKLDIIEHSQQYNLLYSLNLENSVTPECNWGNTIFEWEFPANKELNVYKTAVTNVDVVGVRDLEPLQEKTTYSNIDQAIAAFYDEYPEAKTLSYDYKIEIFSDEKSTYDKMPLYVTLDDLKILTSNLGVWRDLEGKYIAGLYEVSNEFKKFSFNKDDPYFSFPAKTEEDIKHAIKNTEMKFLNHSYLCEDDRVVEKKIDSVEVIYINTSEYLFPVYKIIGEYKVENSNIKWTALVNPIDYTKLDYTIYVNEKLDQEFIPLPYISNITSEDNKYYIEGILPNKLKSLSSNKTQIADSIAIQFIAKEETGEYVWETRKDELLNEIVESLEVDKDGKFKFNFSYENFWKVEKIIYEDDQANELETPQYSSENEIERNSFDNWFKIRVCSKFETEEYCGESSNIYRLENSL